MEREKKDREKREKRVREKETREKREPERRERGGGRFCFDLYLRNYTVVSCC